MSIDDPWQRLDHHIVYDNPWIRVVEHNVINPSGGRGIYGVVQYKHRAVGVLAYHAGEVWLVGQFRFPQQKYSWEIPEGGGRLDETAEAAAQRELLEETGLTAGSLEPLVRMDLSNSVSDEEAIVFLATDLTAGQAMPEETERLALQRVPFAQVLARVEAGEITDSMTVAAIYKLAWRLARDSATSA